MLVGLPGAGKSTVGQAVAERLGRSFLDLDKEIERRESATISALFAERGEHYFRQRERELTEELREIGNMILSPGGGWIANVDVVALLRPPARIIYLKVRPETALRRLGPQQATRPLLVRPDPLGELRRLLEQREPLYATADFIIETERLDVQRVVDEVVRVAASVGRG
ncbi:MAG TPA: shikimate kinase [Gemmatimonadaceae bacterium]|nr:shikimate kinase [Gemmatimonadaceae bacterium]